MKSTNLLFTLLIALMAVSNINAQTITPQGIAPKAGGAAGVLPEDPPKPLPQMPAGGLVPSPAQSQGQIDAQNAMRDRLVAATQKIDPKGIPIVSSNGKPVIDPKKIQSVSLFLGFINAGMANNMSAIDLNSQLILKSGILTPAEKKSFIFGGQMVQMEIIARKLQNLGMANVVPTFINGLPHYALIIYSPNANQKLVYTVLDPKIMNPTGGINGHYNPITPNIYQYHGSFVGGYPLQYSNTAIIQGINTPLQLQADQQELYVLDMIKTIAEMVPSVEAISQALDQLFHGSSGGSSGYGYALLSFCIDLPTFVGAPVGKLKKLYYLLYVAKVGWDVKNTYDSITKNWEKLTDNQKMDMVATLAGSLVLQQVLSSKMELPEAEIAKIQAKMKALDKAHLKMAGQVVLTTAERLDAIDAMNTANIYAALLGAMESLE